MLWLIPFIVAAAGTAISAAGQVKAGNAARRLGDFNAAVAEVQSRDALLRGAEEEGKFRQQVEQLIGTQRAGFAGQMVEVGTGSAADVQADAAYLGELDALTIRSNALRESWGYKVEAENARLGGQNAQAASRWNAGATILGTAGSLLISKYGWDHPSRSPRTPGVIS
jgi:hypothetical protein